MSEVVRITFPWDAAKTYAADDIVEFRDMPFECLRTGANDVSHLVPRGVLDDLFNKLFLPDGRIRSWEPVMPLFNTCRPAEPPRPEPVPPAYSREDDKRLVLRVDHRWTV